MGSYYPDLIILIYWRWSLPIKKLLAIVPMNSWWSFYPPGWFPHLRRALERRPRAVSGLSKAQCLPSAALGMGWNMLKPTVVPWWSWWTWTSKKMLVHVCSLYGIFIIVHSPKEICLRFWSIHSSLSLSLSLAVTCCDLLCSSPQLLCFQRMLASQQVTFQPLRLTTESPADCWRSLIGSVVWNQWALWIWF